jgi:hypothetical protein
MFDAPNVLNFAYHELAATLKQYGLIKRFHQSGPRRQVIINASSSLRINMKSNVEKFLVRILILQHHFRLNYVLKPKYFPWLVVVKL